jgi:hypothetical protein
LKLFKILLLIIILSIFVSSVDAQYSGLDEDVGKWAVYCNEGRQCWTDNSGNCDKNPASTVAIAGDDSSGNTHCCATPAWANFCRDFVKTDWSVSSGGQENIAPVILGCTDSTANNYNSAANQDDGSCTYVVLGCTDNSALNYNSNANQDDGSCTFAPVEVLGCMDLTANNYNSAATQNDGNCEYASEEIIEEPKLGSGLAISIERKGGANEVTCENKCTSLGKDNSGCFIYDELPPEFEKEYSFDLFGILQFGNLGCSANNDCYCWNEVDLDEVQVVETVPAGQIGSICNADGVINHDFCESQFCSKNTGNGIVCEDRCTKLTVNSCGNGKCMNYPICEGASCGIVQRDCVNKGAYSNLLNQMFSIISNDNSEENVEEMRRIVEQYNLKGLGTTVRSSMIGRGYTGFVILDSCSSDFNKNEEVDFDDFFLFADYFGQTRESDNWDSKFDLSENGVIDFDDFFIFSDNFGKKANCKEEIISCIDSDGGKNYGVKGTVTSTAFGGNSETDYCLDNKKLKEFYCSEVDKSPDPKIITCENGCNNGICMETVALSETVLGCTDNNALNYNSVATQDDGSCTYAPVYVLGCTDNGALNYNPNANQDDGSCNYPPEPVLGCTDNNAVNYNPESTQDDGSCAYFECYDGNTNDGEKKFGDYSCDTSECPCDYNKLKELGRNPLNIFTGKKITIPENNDIYTFKLNVSGDYIGRDSVNVIVRDGSGNVIVNKNFNLNFKEKGSFLDNSNRITSGAIIDITGRQTYQSEAGVVGGKKSRINCSLKQNPQLCCPAGYEESNGRCVVKTPRYCADFNNDNKVNFEDFFLLSDSFGSSNSNVDIDKDGKVDFNDFFIFADEFNKEPECDGTSSVTEDDVNGVQEFITLGDSFTGSLNDDHGTLKTLINMNNRGLNIETSLTSNEDDYMTDVVMEIARDSIKYHLDNNGLIGQTFNLVGDQFKVLNRVGSYNDISIEKDGNTYTVKDGDAFFGEDNDDPDWIWDIDVDNNVIGIENDFIYNDDSDNPPGIGDCVTLPNNYAKICLNGLRIHSSEYSTYTIEYDNSADLSDADGSLTSEDSIYIHTSKDNGIKLDNSVNTDKIWITGDKKIFYIDSNDNNVKYWKSLEMSSGFEQASIGTISEDVQLLAIARDGMMEVSVSSQILLSLLTAKFNIDSDGKISALGNIASSEEYEELIYMPIGDYTQNLGTKDEDHRTDHGIIVRDPKAHGSSDEVVLDIPDRQVKASVIMEFN